jgi:hypothetical protein
LKIQKYLTNIKYYAKTCKASSLASQGALRRGDVAASPPPIFPFLSTAAKSHSISIIFFGRWGKFQAAWTLPVTMNFGAKNFSFPIIFTLHYFPLYFIPLFIYFFPISGVATWHKLGKS